MKQEYELELVKLHPNYEVYYIIFPNSYLVAFTFMRLQEFYESPYPNIKGKLFTLEEYMDTYAADKGKFTYFSDWGGFNVPDYIVREFYDRYFGWMTKKEVILWNTIYEPLLETDKKWYLIATHKHTGDIKGYLEHEFAHGLYYLDEEYRKEMISHIPCIRRKDIVFKKITKMGYNDDVLKDEIQAWFATSTLKELHQKISGTITEAETKPFRDTFKRIVK